MSKLKVWFLNVGQGDSTFIEFTDSSARVWRMLIDCNRGTESKGIDVPRFLKDRIPQTRENGKSVRRLDYLIVTHPHSDHIQDLKLSATSSSLASCGIRDISLKRMRTVNNLTFSRNTKRLKANMARPNFTR